MKQLLTALIAISIFAFGSSVMADTTTGAHAFSAPTPSAKVLNTLNGNNAIRRGDAMAGDL
jgi:hypothetical protein